MKRSSYLFFHALFLIILVSHHLLLPTYLLAEASPVRLKDIGRILEARENQLIGFGLVTGLRNTGDSSSTVFTNAALTNLLKKMGVSSAKEFNSRNVASVIVTASLPPYVKKGQRISVTVSSVGDSVSLIGGTLLMTPLQGPDMETYVVAQGPLSIGGLSEQSSNGSEYKNQSTTGRIINGGIVEAEVPITLSDQRNLTFILNESNFVSTTRAAKELQNNGFVTAKAIDANTIKIPLTDIDSSDLITTIAKVENIQFTPDASSDIVINSRTGTIIIGEMVRLSPVAITHGSISIKITTAQQGAANGIGGGAAETADNAIKIEEKPSKLTYLNPSNTLSSLVNALNELGATPQELAEIIQALYESKALTGQIRVL